MHWILPLVTALRQKLKKLPLDVSTMSLTFFILLVKAFHALIHPLYLKLCNRHKTKTMKFLATLFLAALLGSATAVPVHESRTSAYDLLNLLENIVEDEGHALISKIVYLIHKVEDGVVSLKNLVPKVYDNIHKEADEILAELKKISQEVQELLVKKSGNVLYGFDFDFLGGLTELTGNTKLSTVISLIRLADRAHTVAEDAKQFVPNLEKKLTKIQKKIEDHFTVLAEHTLKELGLEEIMALSYVKNLEDLVENVEEELHKLILIVFRNMEEVFDEIKANFPKVYERIESDIEEIRKGAHEIITDIGKQVHNVIGYGLLDVAGDFTSGTSLGTAIKMVSLLDKFNTVVQDAKTFEPKAEIFLHHTVDKVQKSAQEFLRKAVEHLFNDE